MIIVRFLIIKNKYNSDHGRISNNNNINMNSTRKKIEFIKKLVR